MRAVQPESCLPYLLLHSKSNRNSDASRRHFPGAHTMATISVCSAILRASSRPRSAGAINTQNDDHNPARIASRNIFDVAAGDDNLCKGDRYKWSLTLTAINVTNKTALYNFLSTFSGHA